MFGIQKNVVIASAITVLAVVLGGTVNHYRTGHCYKFTKPSVAAPIAALKANGAKKEVAPEEEMEITKTLEKAKAEIAETLKKAGAKASAESAELVHQKDASIKKLQNVVKEAAAVLHTVAAEAKASKAEAKTSEAEAKTSKAEAKTVEVAE